MRRIILSIITLIFSGCATHALLETVPPPETTGKFDLILYGGRYLNDIEAVVILDNPCDNYRFRVFAPSFDFKVEKEINGDVAIKRAKEFLMSQNEVIDIKVAAIKVNGVITGYELRPLYDPLTYGISDVLETEYLLRNNEVIIKIWLKPEIERMLFDGDRIKDLNEN